MTQYEIGGKDGLWNMVSGYVADDYIVIVFQSVGSGEFLEVELCPFHYLINKNINFKEWDL
jgi:hypothetical protein